MAWENEKLWAVHPGENAIVRLEEGKQIQKATYAYASSAWQGVCIQGRYLLLGSNGLVVPGTNSEEESRSIQKLRLYGSGFNDEIDNAFLAQHPNVCLLYTSYITRLSYKNAGEFLDMCVNGALGTEGAVIQETPVDASLQATLQQIAQAYLDSQVSGIQSLAGPYGYKVWPGKAEGTAALRRYRFAAGDGNRYVDVYKRQAHAGKPRRVRPGGGQLHSAAMQKRHRARRFGPAAGAVAGGAGG